MHYLAICNIPDGKDAVASSRNKGLLQLHRLLLVRITDQEHGWRSQGLIGWGIVEESHWIFIRLAKLGLESGFQHWSLMFKQNEQECLCREYQRGKHHCTIDLLFDWFGIGCMTTDNFCFYLQNRLIQTSPTGGQWYSDTSPFNIPCTSLRRILITTWECLYSFYIFY